MIEVASILGFVKFLDLWQVAVLGAVVLFVALMLPFRWQLTLAVLTLAMAEFNIETLRQYSWLWREIRQFCRVIRWFLFLAMALKGLGIALRGTGIVGGSHLVRSLAAMILVLGCLSLAYSYDRHLTAASLLLLGLVFFCSFGVLWRVIDSPERVIEVAVALYRAFWPLLVGSMFVWIVWDVWEKGFFGHRFAGVFMNPNGLGVMAAVFFPIALWQYFRPDVGAVLKTFRGIVVCCSLLAVVASGSRSAFLGLLISASVFLFHRYRAGFPVIVATLTVLFGLIIGAGVFDDVYEEQVAGGQVFAVQRLDPENRLEKWGTAWYYIAERGMDKTALGYGYGTARYVPTGTKIGSDVWQRGAGVGGYDFHSSHLTVWIELGIPGLVLVWALLATIVAAGFQFFRGSGDPALKMVGAALFSSLIVMIGDTFVHGWLFSPGSGLGFIFWCYTALVVRTTQFLEPRPSEDEVPAPMPALRGA